MEFNSKSRRKSIKVWLSDEERELIEVKAIQYGYKALSKYIRDATIYEKVTYVDIDNRKQIYEAYANNTKEIKKIGKQIRHISKYATQIQDKDIKNITNLMMEMFKNQKDIYKLIENKLNLKVWKEINHDKLIKREENASNKKIATL